MPLLQTEADEDPMPISILNKLPTKLNNEIHTKMIKDALNPFAYYFPNERNYLSTESDKSITLNHNKYQFMRILNN